MNTYLLIKTLHILSSTIVFGTGLGSAYYSWRAWRTGRVEVIAVTFRHLVFADWAFTATTGIFQPLSGLWMVSLAGWSLTTPWVFWSLVLYVVAGACWIPVLWLQIRVHKVSEACWKEGRPLPVFLNTYMWRWFTLGWPAFVAFIAIFYLMVNKPSWPVPF